MAVNERTSMKSVNYIQNEDPAAQRGYALGDEITLVGDFRAFSDEMFFDFSKQVIAAYENNKITFL